MLSYALAIAVAISSLVLFSTAFLMSDIHRQDDFLWSALGLIYALVLWFCARNITGAVLLGQASASILLVSYGWQTLKLRKAVANPDRAVEINNFSILQTVNGFLSRRKSPPKVTATPSATITNPKVTESEIAIPDRVSPKTEQELSKTDTPEKDLLSEPKKQDNQSKESEIVATPTSNISAPIESKTSSTDLPATSDRPTVIDTVESEAKETSKVEVNEPIVSTDTVAPNKIIEPEKIVSVSDPAVTTEQQDKTSNQPETTVESTPDISPVEPGTLPPTNDTPKITEVESAPDVSPVEPETLPATADTPKITEEVQPDKPQTKNDLDSLETVEVAEILDEIPEDRSSKSNSDKTNIIEVTTTEIDAIAQEPKTQSNPEQDS